MSLVLITGGAGFIGSHITPYLIKAGFVVRILDSIEPQIHGMVPVGLDWLSGDGIEFIRGSVTSKKDLEVAIDGVSFIIHLAAETGTGQSMYEIARYNFVNTQATALLMDVLTNNAEKHHVKRIILASSRSVYGEGAYVCPNCGDGVRVYPGSRSARDLESGNWNPLCDNCGSILEAVATTEADAVSPASIYAATKYAQEDIVRIGCDSLNIDYAVLRFQNVYGEGQSLNNPYTGILSIFSTRIRRGIGLTLFEDGLESRDFVHVDDVAVSIKKALMLDKDIKSVINIGSGIATTVTDVANKLVESLNGNVGVTVTGEYRVGDIRHNFADISRMKNILGHAPAIDIDEGLRRFSAWVETQPLPEDLLEKANNELRARKLMG